MKRFLVLLFLATFTAVAADQARAQNNGPSSTDDAVSSISSIKRPKPTPASAGPKKGLQVTLTSEEKGDTSMGSFSSTTPKIYLRWNNDSGAKGETIRAEWYGGSKGKKLSENTQTMPGPSATGQFYLAEPAGGFPAGKYSVKVYDGTKLAKSMTFTITK